jgi:CheY-like chemotaxis protein
MSGSAVHILLVEDDDGQATLVERNLRRAGVSNGFTRLSDGAEALEFFFGESAKARDQDFASVVVLLDLNMPKVGGVEVLERMKSSPATVAVPVIILTTTDDPREIKRCYELGCNVYITKPVDYEAFIEAIRRLGFFLQIVKIPEVKV